MKNFRAFLRTWVRQEWLAESSEEDFEQLFNVTVNGILGRTFRRFHAEYGRYPTCEDLSPPDGPTIGIIPDI
jgi:hypothetical protein